MPPDLTRLNTISRKPSSADYDPNRHAVPLNQILESHSQESTNAVRLPLQQLQLNVTQDEATCEGSFQIRLFDAASGEIREVVFAEFDSNVITTLESSNKQVKESISVSTDDSVTQPIADDRDPLLCETILRSLFARGKSEFILEERLLLADNVKRAFTFSESIYREAEARAAKAAQHRRAEIRAQLEDLQQDKGWYLDPKHFESFSLYEKCKLDEIEELSSIEASLGKLLPFFAQVQVSILSAEDLGSEHVSCMKPPSCYGRPEEAQVYCTVKVVTSSKKLDKEEDIVHDHVTKEVRYLDRAEWNDKSPWIPVNSVHDQLCIEVWRKRASTRQSKGYIQIESGSFKISMSQRKKKVSWNGDLFLGQLIMSIDRIRSQALSSGSIQGSIPSKSYPLTNARGGKNMSTIRLRIGFACEQISNDPVPDKLSLKPPVNDLEAAYDALVRVAFGMHLEGEFQLEQTWQNILACFESYYRLRRERCCLAVVMQLAKLFQPDIDYLETTVRDWKPICKAAKEGRLNKNELLLHAQIVVLLVRPSVNALEDFQSMFHSNQPKGALSKLIELLSLTLCWDPNPKEVVTCFKRWIKVSCVQRFVKHLSENSSEGEITSRSLSEAISLLRKDLDTLDTCFKNEFQEEIHLLQVCSSEYYRLVSQYITGFIDATSFKISTKDFVDMATELSLLHKELERKGVAVNLLDLHGLFRDHILDLVATMKPRMIDCIISSISDEKWEPISPLSYAFFSFSVVDLYFMINGVVEDITARLSCFPFGKLYYSHIENAICTAVGTYLQITEKLCLQELPDDSDEDHSFLAHFKSANFTNAVCISKTLCVKLNNMHAVLQQQISLEENLTKKWENYERPSLTQSGTNDLGSNYLVKENDRIAEMSGIEDLPLEEKVGQQFANLHSLIERSKSNVIGSIVECMQNELTKRLQKVMEIGSTNRQGSLIDDLEILTTYLDDHLKVLNEWLDPEVFKYILLDIAGALLFCMEEFALNRDDDPNPMTARQRARLEEILRFFYEYFYGDGLGISKPQMDHVSARLRKILVCSDLHTRDLCTLYWKAWDRFNTEENAQGPAGSNGFSKTHVDNDEVHLHVLDFLLLLQQRDDEEARTIAATQNLIAKNKMMQTPCWREKESLPKRHFEMPREMVRGVAQYLRAIQMPFPPPNVSYLDFRRMKEWWPHIHAEIQESGWAHYISLQSM